MVMEVRRETLLVSLSPVRAGATWSLKTHDPRIVSSRVVVARVASTPVPRLSDMFEKLSGEKEPKHPCKALRTTPPATRSVTTVVPAPKAKPAPALRRVVSAPEGASTIVGKV